MNGFWHSQSCRAGASCARSGIGSRRNRTEAVNWPHVWAYIALSFGLAWLVDLVLYLNSGLKHPVATLMLQFQMLMPTFYALLLAVFFFKK
jgi:hypothetical protein